MESRLDFTDCLTQEKHTNNGASSRESSQNARTLFLRGWANKALGDLSQAAADFESARLLEPLDPHLSVNYRNIFDTELVMPEDDEPLIQTPALFHSW